MIPSLFKRRLPYLLLVVFCPILFVLILGVYGSSRAEGILIPLTPGYNIVPEQIYMSVCKPDISPISFNVDVTSMDGYSQTVNLSPQNFPEGVSPAFDPPSATAPFTSLFTLDIQPSAPEGHFYTAIRGADEGSIYFAEVPLYIYSQPPASSSLNTPADGAADVSPAPFLYWSDTTRAVTYHLQVANSPTFTNPILDVSDISGAYYYESQVLPSDRCAWWRVAAENACDKGDWSSPFRFSTYPYAFFDNLENGTSNFVEGKVSGPDEQWELAEGPILSGNSTHSYYSPEQASASDTWIQTTSFVVPEGGPELSFRHKYMFEPGNYDGGVLEVSTDSGATWLDITKYVPYFTYPGVLNSFNPLGVRPAWVGQSPNWHEENITLYPFVGQTIMLRWRLGTDNSVDADGWYIDDIQVTSTHTPSSAPVADSVFPNEGANIISTPITITGQNFGAPVYLQLGENYLSEVTLVDANTLQANVPSGLPGGTYTMTVYNGDCQATILPEAFTVVEAPLTVTLTTNAPVNFGEPVLFSAVVTGGASPFTYTWDFGGPGTGSGFDTATPTYAYSAYGDYQVTLTVKDSHGDSAQATLHVYIEGNKIFLPAVIR